MNVNITVMILFFFGFISSAQQIGEGHAPIISDFTVPLKSGIYNGLTPIGMTPDNNNPWQHLFVARHTSQINNYQLQIGSSFAVNDRLFFRKIVVSDLSSSNTNWIELATRSTNTFIGAQHIKGNLTLDGNNVNDEIVFESQNGFHRIAFHELRFWDWQTGDVMTINNGNIGIGTTNPDAKLAVNGTIHSKEVKVDMIGWSDFVFKKEYELPTLEEVEKHITEKGHLENIPSEEEVLKKGINLGEMNAKLLQKIEEFTLYMIEQNKQIQLLKKENNEMKKDISILKTK